MYLGTAEDVDWTLVELVLVIKYVRFPVDVEAMLKLITEGNVAVVPLGPESVVPLDPDCVEFEDNSERGCPVVGDIAPPVPEPTEPLPERVEFQTLVSEGELAAPVPTEDCVIIPSDSHPLLEAPLTVVT